LARPVNTIEFVDAGGHLLPSIDLTWQEHRMESLSNAEWYRIDNIDEIDSPSLVVFSLDAARLQLAEGISRSTCATIAEAEMPRPLLLSRRAKNTCFSGLPYHTCPTCALYERAVTVTNHRADGEWTMAARDRRISE
jgi:hypothetical protein